MHGSIYLWSWSRTKAQRPNKQSRAVCAVVLAELQWTNTEIPYLALNTCPGTSRQPEASGFSRSYTSALVQCVTASLSSGCLSSGQAYIVCGDDKGKLWTYHVTDLRGNSFQPGKPVQPTEVTSPV